MIAKKGDVLHDLEFAIPGAVRAIEAHWPKYIISSNQQNHQVMNQGVYLTATGRMRYPEQQESETILHDGKSARRTDTVHDMAVSAPVGPRHPGTG